MRRLSWAGSIRAQAEADEAYSKLQNKPKPKANRKRRKRRCPPPRYALYLRSSAWKKQRLLAIARAGEKCDLCGSTIGLHVHHTTYRRLGREKKCDLQVLCRNCHLDKHPEHLESHLPSELRCPRFTCDSV